MTIHRASAGTDSQRFREDRPKRRRRCRVLLGDLLRAVPTSAPQRFGPPINSPSRTSTSTADRRSSLASTAFRLSRCSATVDCSARAAVCSMPTRWSPSATSSSQTARASGRRATQRYPALGSDLVTAGAQELRGAGASRSQNVGDRASRCPGARAGRPLIARPSGSSWLARRRWRTYPLPEQRRKPR